MARRPHRIVPSGAFRTQEVPIDRLLDICNRGFSTLMRRVGVLVPPIEAGLVARVVELTVMD